MATSSSARIKGAAGKRLLAAMLGVLLAAWCPALAGDSVSFPSLDGSLTGGKPTLLRGLLMKPEGIGPFPAIVALHGCNGLFNKEGGLVAREAAWAQLLTSRGYVVLFPDSFGPRDVATDCEGSRRHARDSERASRCVAVTFLLRRISTKAVKGGKAAMHLISGQ
jgi:dienelactone hydrolase